MAINVLKVKVLPAATRFATWVLPPHRKEWAEAMLNEVAYVESTRRMLRWMAGCLLSATKARVSYEVEKIFMSRRILRTCLALATVMVVTMVGVYAIQKPYQRERINIFILKHIEGSSMPPAQSGK
jgi:hypothetical protein